MNILQESQVLVAKQLINYANLDVERKPFRNDDDELRFRVIRLGCPLSEKKLREEMSDLCRSIVRNLDLPFETKKQLRRSVDLFKTPQLKVMLLSLVS